MRDDYRTVDVERVKKMRDVAGVVGALVGGRIGPAALPVAAQIERQSSHARCKPGSEAVPDVSVSAHPMQQQSRLFAAGIAGFCAPIQIVQRQLIYPD